MLVIYSTISSKDAFNISSIDTPIYASHLQKQYHVYSIKPLHVNYYYKFRTYLAINLVDLGCRGIEG